MNRLEGLLFSVDRKSYSAYKALKGSYDFKDFSLHIEHVQGDPFASPSKLSVCVRGSRAGFPTWMYGTKQNKIALQDYLLRNFYKQVGIYTHKAKGSGKSGVISVTKCGQEVIERTGCEVNPKDGTVRVRLEVGFPANGRTIRASELHKMLFEYLPNCVRKALFYERLRKEELQQTINLAEDQQSIRQQIKEKQLVAFVANGAILPRESGVLDTPLSDAIPFCSPKEMEVVLSLPHAGDIKGMGIKQGITLIVGGGYHGKSTLLQALERGVYNHRLRDGREYVITDQCGIKIRAEDGRSVCGTNISPFIGELPNKKDTTAFYTEDASGSTSQAANVIEAIETGTTLLLFDEDTSATNFMVRDALMQRVVHKEKEPIIPFVSRAKQMYEELGISTIMVAGSSGAYFHVADEIIQMDEYVPRNITLLAKKESESFPLELKHDEKLLVEKAKRVPKYNQDLRGNPKIKMKVLGKDSIVLQKEVVDLRLVEQIVDVEQMQALGYILWYMEAFVFDCKKNISQCIDDVMELIEKQGMGAIVKTSALPGNIAIPRREEIYACLNRYRGLQI
ncbi:ABC-ATPase domain-containing protein [Lachnospiraceae bacterium LCP25S3_G4]